MRKRFLIVGLVLMALATLGFAGIVSAQDPPVAETATGAVEAVAEVAGPLPEVDPGAAAKTLFEGIGAGLWILICGGGGLVLIYLLRLLLLPNLKGKALAITSVVLIAVAAGLTTMLVGGGVVACITTGLGAGFTAGKAWDIIPDSWTTAMEKPIKKRQK